MRRLLPGRFDFDIFHSPHCIALLLFVTRIAVEIIALDRRPQAAADNASACRRSSHRGAVAPRKQVTTLLVVADASIELLLLLSALVSF